MTYMHIGKDFTPPDAEGKITGQARYSEDFRKEGMVFARLGILVGWEICPVT